MLYSTISADLVKINYEEHKDINNNLKGIPGITPLKETVSKAQITVSSCASHPVVSHPAGSSMAHPIVLSSPRTDLVQKSTSSCTEAPVVISQESNVSQLDHEKTSVSDASLQDYLTSTSQCTSDTVCCGNKEQSANSNDMTKALSPKSQFLG